MSTSPTRCMPGAALHGLRDLAGLYRFDPEGQVWTRAMADLLIDANAAATAAAAAGTPVSTRRSLARIRARYRGAVAKGITDNQRKRTETGKDGLRLARRFRDHQDMILRFTTDLAVGFTSNQAERDVRPVKVQMRTSGGCWRTLQGLADFAIVQSYLSTAGKWGIDALDALTRLFTGQPWLPPANRTPVNHHANAPRTAARQIRPPARRRVTNRHPGPEASSASGMPPTQAE